MHTYQNVEPLSHQSTEYLPKVKSRFFFFPLALAFYLEPLIDANTDLY